MTADRENLDRFLVGNIMGNGWVSEFMTDIEKTMKENEEKKDDKRGTK
jgi:hypothetical protein